MKILPCFLGLLLLAGGCASSSSLSSTQPGPLARKQTIALPDVRGTRPKAGVPGRIDHGAYDPITQRLFIAALENGSLEVVDLKKGKRIQSITGLKQPQGAAIITNLSLVVVACGGDDSIHVYNTKNLEEKATFQLGEDADNVRYDAAHNTILVSYATTNGGAIGVIDVATWKKVGEFTFSSRPESFQLDLVGNRLFANLPRGTKATTDGVVAVMNLTDYSQIAKIPLLDRARNFPMAFDVKHQRLFIATRLPARLIEIDTQSYQVTHDVPCVDDSDDLFYDIKRNRVMVIGGGFRSDMQSVNTISTRSPAGEMGCVDVFSVGENGELAFQGNAITSRHARTGVYTPLRDKVYVFAPFQWPGEAQLFELQPEN